MDITFHSPCYDRYSGVIRKNKVTDNLVKIGLDMSQAFMRASAQFHGKTF